MKTVEDYVAEAIEEFALWHFDCKICPVTGTTSTPFRKRERHEYRGLCSPLRLRLIGLVAKSNPMAGAYRDLNSLSLSLAELGAKSDPMARPFCEACVGLMGLSSRILGVLKPLCPCFQMPGGPFEVRERAFQAVEAYHRRKEVGEGSEEGG